MTASEFIDALGGNQVVAEIAGVGTNAVSNWRRLGCIPPALYFRFRDSDLKASARRLLNANEDIFREPTRKRD